MMRSQSGEVIVLNDVTTYSKVPCKERIYIFTNPETQ